MDEVVDNRRVWELVSQFESSRGRNNRLPNDYILGEAGNGWFQVWSTLQKGLETQVPEPKAKSLIRNTTNSINNNGNITSDNSLIYDDNSTINSMQSTKTMNISNVSVKTTKSTPLANAISMLSVDQKNKLLGALNAAERSLIVGTPFEGQLEGDLQSKLGYGMNLDADVESDLQSLATFNSLGTMSTTTTTNILPKSIRGKGGINYNHTNNKNPNNIPTMINFNNNMSGDDGSSSVKSIFSSSATGEGTNKKSKSRNKFKVASKWEKFLPRETYERKDAAKGLASNALKKIGRAMSQVGVDMNVLGFKSGPLVGYAELRLRLKNDLGLELKMSEVDQLMRKFDPDSSGKIEYEAVLGCAKLLNDQRERRRKFNILMDQKKRNGKKSLLSMSLRTDDNAMDKLGAAAFDAAVSTDGKASIEFSKTTGGIWEISNSNRHTKKNDKEKYQCISRDEFQKLLKDMHLGLTQSETETLEKRYMDVQNESINLIAFKSEFKRLGQSLMESVRQQGSVASFYHALGAQPQEVDDIIQGKLDKPLVLIGKTGADIADAKGIATTTGMSTEGLRFMIDESLMNSTDKEEFRRLNQALDEHLQSQSQSQSQQHVKQSQQKSPHSQQEVESTHITTTRAVDAYVSITPHGSINGPLTISIPPKDDTSMGGVDVTCSVGVQLEIPAGSILEPLPTQLRSSPPASVAAAEMNPFAPRGSPLPPANHIKEQSPASSPDKKNTVPMYHQGQHQESPLSSSMGRVAAATAASAPIQALVPSSHNDPLDPFRNSGTTDGITLQTKQPLYEMGDGKARVAMTEKYIQNFDPLTADIDNNGSHNIHPGSDKTGKTNTKKKKMNVNRASDPLDMLLLDPLATGMIVDEDGNAKKVKKVKSDKKGSAAALAAASEDDPFAHLRKPISSVPDTAINATPAMVTTPSLSARPLPAVQELEEERAENEPNNGVNDGVNDSVTGGDEPEQTNVEGELDPEAVIEAARVQELLAELEEDVARATTAEQKLEQGADPSDVLAALLNSAAAAPPAPSLVSDPKPSPVPPSNPDETTTTEVVGAFMGDKKDTVSLVPAPNSNANNITGQDVDTDEERPSDVLMSFMGTTEKNDMDVTLEPGVGVVEATVAPTPLIIDHKAETRAIQSDTQIEPRVDDRTKVKVEIEMDEDDAEEDEQASFDEAALLAEIEAEDNRLLAMHGLGPASTSTSTPIFTPAIVPNDPIPPVVPTDMSINAEKSNVGQPPAEFEIKMKDEIAISTLPSTQAPVDTTEDVVGERSEVEVDMLSIAMHGDAEVMNANVEVQMTQDDQVSPHQPLEIEQQQSYGWYRYFNDGNYYYYNHDTGESSWSEPVNWTDAGEYNAEMETGVGHTYEAYKGQFHEPDRYRGEVQELATNDAYNSGINAHANGSSNTTVESNNVPVPTEDQIPITIVDTTTFVADGGDEDKDKDKDSIDSRNNVNGKSKSYHGLPTKKVATSTNASKSYLSLANAKSPTSGDGYKIDPFRLNTPNKY